LSYVAAVKARVGRHALVHTGVLVQADISGYTRYVSQTAIQDSSATVRELLAVLVDEVGDRLEAAQFEGDSVTFVGDVRAPELVEILEQTYVAFKRRLRDMQKRSSCDCEACARTTDLALKFIAHRGEYAWQSLGGVREQLHGTDVNKSFRLLKNHVPLSEYLLLTSSLLEQLDDGDRSGYTPHVEEYEHVGRVECGFRSLAPVWERAKAGERTRVLRDEAGLYSEVVVPTSIERTWEMLTEPESVRRLHASLRIATRTGARGTDLGAVYTCDYADPDREPEVIRVTGSEQPAEHSVVYETRSTGPLFMTAYLSPEGAGTRVGTAWLWESSNGARRAFTRASVGARMKQLHEHLVALSAGGR
jgi:hypothetical protein